MGKSGRKQTGAHDPKTGEKRVDKVTLKELREKFYELRDLEIQNLWQRASIFAGLIGLFFAGYGYILKGFLLEGEGEIKEVELAHVLCCGIAILAIIFSVIWIAMAKGAKAWFEVQERKICEIEEEEELAIPRRFRMGALSYPGIDSEPNDCLLSGEGGRYSVSKLNILLGQVLFICWCCIFLLHAFFLIFKEWDSFNLTGFSLYVCIGMWVGLFVLFVCLILKEAKSGALLTTEGYLEKRLDLLKDRLKEENRDVLCAIKTELQSLLADVSDKDAKTRVDVVLGIVKERELKTEISLLSKSLSDAIIQDPSQDALWSAIKTELQSLLADVSDKDVKTRVDVVLGIVKEGELKTEISLIPKSLSDAIIEDPNQDALWSAIKTELQSLLADVSDKDVKTRVDIALGMVKEEELKTEISLFFKNVLEVIDNEQKKLESSCMHRIRIKMRNCIHKLIKKLSCKRERILNDTEKKYIRRKYIKPLIDELNKEG